MAVVCTASVATGVCTVSVDGGVCSAAAPSICVSVGTRSVSPAADAIVVVSAASVSAAVVVTAVAAAAAAVGDAVGDVVFCSETVDGVSVTVSVVAASAAAATTVVSVPGGEKMGATVSHRSVSHNNNQVTKEEAIAITADRNPLQGLVNHLLHTNNNFYSYYREKKETRTQCRFQLCLQTGLQRINSLPRL